MPKSKIPTTNAAYKIIKPALPNTAQIVITVMVARIMRANICH
jgi:hypothetical protein